MASDPTRYTGYRLSEALAIGRTSRTIACAPCGKTKSYPIASLMERLGDEIMITVLTHMTASCPMRAKDGRCQAVYADPMTPEDEARIKAMRVSGESPYPMMG